MSEPTRVATHITYDQWLHIRRLQLEDYGATVQQFVQAAVAEKLAKTSKQKVTS